MKRLRVIMLLLLLGAIVNVAVAWGIALKISVFDMPEDGLEGKSITNGENWEMYRYDAFGTHFYLSTRYKIVPLDEEAFAEYLAEYKEKFIYNPIGNVQPNWGSMDVTTNLYQTLPGPPKQAQEARIFDARGWPMLSLWCLRSLKVYEGFKINELEPSGFIATPFLPNTPWGPRGLPLYPIWPGFVFNMIFYDVILWLLILGPFALRRFIRHKRGLCVKCSYDLRGVDHKACPECGEEIRKGNPA